MNNILVYAKITVTNRKSTSEVLLYYFVLELVNFRFCFLTFDNGVKRSTHDSKGGGNVIIKICRELNRIMAPL